MDTFYCVAKKQMFPKKEAESIVKYLNPNSYRNITNFKSRMER